MKFKNFLCFGLFNKLKSESLFLIATFFAIITSFIIRPKFSYIDTHVLMVLFNLMVVVELYKKENILDFIAINFLKKYNNQKVICAALILLVFFFSMLLTNDVALITFIPLTIIIGKKSNFSTLKIVILETITANLGSALTPMGSPQNIYIYSKYAPTSIDFFKITFGISTVGIIILLIINFFTPKEELLFELETPIFKKNINVVVSTFIFISVLLCIFLKFPIIYVTTFNVVYLIYRKENILQKLDWILLATFISFFIFVGNLSNIELIKNWMINLLSDPKQVYFTGIVLSQIISNVPAAILISEFTNKWQPLLLGVNIGGLGTLIASLASLISYKFYISEFPEEKRKYLTVFSILNFSILILIGSLFIFFI
ncbi:SLC13 family permease (plasmid) [Cetobacterium somerae]|uniref:SLC13 family permease n=1 Tax=Cetobacterium somerae TaxID=188913 RepID=UPI003D768D4D